MAKFAHAFGVHGIVVAFALSIVGLVVLLWFGHHSTTAGIYRAEAAYEARRYTLLALTDLLDQETGLRGYTSTYDSAYLAPYLAARPRINIDLRLARQAARDAQAPVVDASLLDAAAVYRTWLAKIARPLIAQPNRRNKADLQFQGKLLMDRMRADAAHADKILDTTSALDSKHTQRRLDIGAVLVGLIGLALYCAILIAIRAQRLTAAERDRIIDTAQDLIGVARMDGFFINLNPAAERILGRTREELLSKPFISFVHPDDVGGTNHAMSGLADGQSVEGFRHRYLAADGSYRWLVWNSVPDVQRGLIYASARDETERVEFEIEREHLAHSDALTGLPNRLAFLTHASRALAEAGKHPLELAVILLDLNGFKAVNDDHGHLAGDELLRAVGHSVRSALRESDFVARLGGDEFTILLQAQSGTLDVEVVRRKIEDSICKPHCIQGREVRVSASIGVAIYPQDGDSAQTLLASADDAMYRAKRLIGSISAAVKMT